MKYVLHGYIELITNQNVHCGTILLVLVIGHICTDLQIFCTHLLGCYLLLRYMNIVRNESLFNQFLVKYLSYPLNAPVIAALNGPLAVQRNAVKRLDQTLTSVCAHLVRLCKKRLREMIARLRKVFSSPSPLAKNDPFGWEDNRCINNSQYLLYSVLFNCIPF